MSRTLFIDDLTIVESITYYYQFKGKKKFISYTISGIEIEKGSHYKHESEFFKDKGVYKSELILLRAIIKFKGGTK